MRKVSENVVKINTSATRWRNSGYTIRQHIEQLVENYRRNAPLRQRESSAAHMRRNGAWREAWIEAPESGFYQYRTFYTEFLYRVWMPRLSQSEWKVLCLILERTLMWRKEWEEISMRQFTTGTRADENGFQVYGGTGLSEDTVRAALQALNFLELIRFRPGPHENSKSSYALTRLEELVEHIERPGSRLINFRARRGRLRRVLWPR